MKLPEFLTEAPFGEIRVTGSRIGLFHVVHYHGEGFSPEMLHDQFPSLSVELIGKVLAFYRDHKAEVDAYMARCRADMEQRYAAAPKLDLAELQRRLPAKGGKGPK